MTTFKIPPILVSIKTGGILFLEILAIHNFLFPIILSQGEKWKNSTLPQKW